jgi:hypothetical protein
MVTEGGAIRFDCVLGARLLEISGSSFVANGDGGVVEGGGVVDASSGPQPVICVGAECNNGNFTCAEYMIYVETAMKRPVQQACLGNPLGWSMVYEDLTFFNLPEGVTTVLADGDQIADLCPAECSEVVSQVSHTTTNTTTQCSYMN